MVQPTTTKIAEVEGNIVDFIMVTKENETHIPDKYMYRLFHGQPVVSSPRSIHHVRNQFQDKIGLTCKGCMLKKNVGIILGTTDTGLVTCKRCLVTLGLYTVSYNKRKKRTVIVGRSKTEPRKTEPPIHWEENGFELSCLHCGVKMQRITPFCPECGHEFVSKPSEKIARIAKQTQQLMRQASKSRQYKAAFVASEKAFQQIKLLCKEIDR